MVGVVVGGGGGGVVFYANQRRPRLNSSALNRFDKNHSVLQERKKKGETGSEWCQHSAADQSTLTKFHICRIREPSRRTTQKEKKKANGEEHVVQLRRDQTELAIRAIHHRHYSTEGKKRKKRRGEKKEGPSYGLCRQRRECGTKQ